jgi:hypothetical protein
MNGREAGHDLRLFVEDLSDSAHVAADNASEPVFTIDDLSRELRVSTKTIARWRREGLVSRVFVFDGRKRVGFLKSSVDRFVANNWERVRRGSQFSQLSDEERKRIIQRARRLAQAGRGPADVTKRLARLTGRSVETIRYTLKQHDQEHPALAIFSNSYGPLREETKQEIDRRFRQGESAEALAKRFRRSRARIYGIVAEMRTKRIVDLPLISPDAGKHGGSPEAFVTEPTADSDREAQPSARSSGKGSGAVVSPKPTASSPPSPGNSSQESGGASRAVSTHVSTVEKKAVLAALKEAGKPLVMWLIADGSGIGQERLEEILPVLVSKGLVNRIEAADAVRYALA